MFALRRSQLCRRHEKLGEECKDGLLSFCLCSWRSTRVAISFWERLRSVSPEALATLSSLWKGLSRNTSQRRATRACKGILEAPVRSEKLVATCHWGQMITLHNFAFRIDFPDYAIIFTLQNWFGIIFPVM